MRVLQPLFERWRSSDRPLAALLQVAGIDAEPEAEARLPEPVVARLCEAAVLASGDGAFALQAGALAEPQSLGALGYVLQNCETVGAAFAHLQRHWCWLHDQPLFSLQQRHGQARITLQAKPRGQVQSRQALIEYLIGYLLRLSGSLVGGPDRGAAYLREVRFRFQAPGTEQQAAYTTVFHQAAIRYEQAQTAVIFDAHLLQQRVPFADAGLREAFESRLQADLRSSIDHPTVRQVQEILSRRLPGKAPTVQETARQLAMSRATLQRRLATEGKSFAQLLEERREQLARQWLQDSDHSIGEVAFMLGYADRPAFHNAFRRWTGETPQGFRGRRVRSRTAMRGPLKPIPEAI